MAVRHWMILQGEIALGQIGNGDRQQPNARSGRLPAGHAFDPGALELLEKPELQVLLHAAGVGLWRGRPAAIPRGHHGHPEMSEWLLPGGPTASKQPVGLSWGFFVKSAETSIKSM